MDKHLRDIITTIRDEGFAIVSIEKNKHIKVRVEKDGIESVNVISISPSDHRWRHHVIKFLHRAHRQAVELVRLHGGARR